MSSSTCGTMPVHTQRVDDRADEALQVRIDNLEARLADASSADAHVTALYTGMRALVAELIRRRRQTEKTCETLTQVLEATSDAFFAVDAEWRFTYVNAHAQRMFGRNGISLIGTSIRSEFPDLVAQPFYQEYEQAVADGSPREVNAYYPPFGGWFETRVYPYAGGLAVFFQDVSARHDAESRPPESEQRYRSLFDRHPDAIYSFDPEGRFVSANAACEGLTGYRLDELIGTSFLPLIVPEDRERAGEFFRVAMAGRSVAYEEWILHKSGRRIEISITKMPIVVDGQVVGIFGIAKDLTARRELEARLHQAQKMEAVGRLAAGVAHDFNNLLTIIQSCASLITQDLPAGEQIRSDAEEILMAAGRAAELTQQLLAFSRKQVLQPQRLDLNRQITSFAGTLRRVVGGAIAVETTLVDAPWPVFADPGQLQRVFMNLGMNARDAMPNGGALSIRTDNVVLDAEVAANLDLAAGRYVCVTVEDTGTGIDPVVLPHIFEPFVTTKAHGVGTGLGLSTVYGIVEQTGGAIQVSSSPGAGSRFTIYLPRAADEPVQRSAVA